MGKKNNPHRISHSHHKTPIPSSLPWGLARCIHHLHLASLTSSSGGGSGGGIRHPGHGGGVRVRGGGGEWAGESFKVSGVYTSRELLDLLLAHQRDDLVEDLEVRPVRACSGVAALDVLRRRERWKDVG